MRASYFDNAEIIFVLFDKDLNFLDINENLLKSHNVKRWQFIGKNLSEISTSAADEGLQNSLLEVVRTGNPIILENIKGDKRYGGKHYRIKAFKVGDGVGLTASDIDGLKRLIYSLEQYAYRSSHDVRTPISSIQGLLEYIKETDEREPDQLRHYLDLIKDQIEKVDDLTKMLLETIKIEKQERPFEKINLEELMFNAWQSLSFMENFNKISFHHDIAMSNSFYFDKTAMSFIFQNLLENAIKYNRFGEENKPRVHVIISGTARTVKIVISDNGIGIPEHIQPKIFGIFFRASHTIAGNGLGLYTLKKTIEGFGGSIKMSSKHSHGTSFTIELPTVQKKL